MTRARVSLVKYRDGLEVKLSTYAEDLVACLLVVVYGIAPKHIWDDTEDPVAREARVDGSIVSDCMTG